MDYLCFIDDQCPKGCKIKRSISNFDDNLYCKTRWDNPWKLQRPSVDRTKDSLLAQYLSFEFLNERITNRLQQELQPAKCLPYYCWDSKSTEQFNSKFSSSETNLQMNTTAASSSAQSNPSVSKQKSFKKLFEQYFTGDATPRACNTLDSVSSNGSVFTLGSSAIGQFDQNFILKRSTPNAGLTDNDRFQQSNLKGKQSE